MRRTLILACSLAFVGQRLPAQSTVLSGRSEWTDQSPRVRVSIDGARVVSPGAPMRIRFEVSDDAFVTVVRVDSDGRMTILFPYSRNQRAAARGGVIHEVRNPRLGDVSFFATDRMGGYVFALASYAPLDFTGFENRDYDRLGGYSAFTQVNRNIAARPDVFIDRFAAAVLWDRDTPYDYDVDYYTPSGVVQNAYSMCGSMFNSYRGNSPYTLLPSWAPGWMWTDWDLIGYPYGSMCRNWYNNLRCFSYLSMYSYTACNPAVVVAGGGYPTTPVPVDTAGLVTPNEGVVRGGMAAPTPLPVLPGDANPPPVERPRSGPTPRFAEGNDWEKIMSIPARATRRMKEEDDVRRDRGAAEGTSPARTTRERPEVNGKRETPRTADASTRSNPPRRETPQTREAPERRERPRTSDEQNRNWGTSATGTSAPRPTTSSPGRTIETKPTTETKPPATTGTASKPPSTTTTTEKPTKPPQN